MAFSPIVFSHPADELLASAVLALTDGTLDTGYALSGLFDGAPSKGVRFTTDHAQIDADHGSEVSLHLAILVHTNIRSTATVTLKRSNAADFSTGVTHTFTMTDADAFGLRPNPWLDLHADGTYQYTRLTITNAGANIIIGQLLYYTTLRQLTANIQEKPRLTPATNTLALRTNAGIKLKTSRGVRMWRLEASAKQTAEALADLMNWFGACQGAARNFGMIWNPAANDAWYAEWGSDEAMAYTPYGPYLFALDIAPSWNEISRGQVWP